MGLASFRIFVWRGLCSLVLPVRELISSIPRIQRRQLAGRAKLFCFNGILL
jgi:hypothetical protein